MVKTWTLSERLVTKKTYIPSALLMNLVLIRTYLLCALSRHSPLFSRVACRQPGRLELKTELPRLDAGGFSELRRWAEGTRRPRLLRNEHFCCHRPPP